MARQDEELRELVSGLVGPLAADRGLEVLQVAVSGPANRRLVRITADVVVPLPARADGELPPGIEVDAVAALSRDLGDLLDERDTVPGTYTLEVTSPGVSAPLTGPQAFARNVGRQVRVERRAAQAGEAAGDVTMVTGELREVTVDGLTLVTDDGEVTLGHVEVAHGTVVLPW